MTPARSAGPHGRADHTVHAHPLHTHTSRTTRSGAGHQTAHRSGHNRAIAPTHPTPRPHCHTIHCNVVHGHALPLHTHASRTTTSAGHQTAHRSSYAPAIARTPPASPLQPTNLVTAPKPSPLTPFPPSTPHPTSPRSTP